MTSVTKNPILDLPVHKKPTYMIYYGEADERAVESARKYDVAILHPSHGNLTREIVKRIQSAGTKVLGYISVGEDLRTYGMTAEEMLADGRFTGDGSGPKVDPRAEGDTSLPAACVGSTSPGGSGFASYYLDDNDRDGRPDFNPNFGCAYTNIGDPDWYVALNDMLLDGADKAAGIREILTTKYGRGLGCDGLFLDTVDTCAPNSYTSDSDPARTRFEWTAAGTAAFMERVRQEYPDKLICQNRGLFFYNHLLEHYRYSPGKYIDFLFFESYMMDSDAGALFNEGFFADNKFSLAPKLAVEAGRPDGFKVLSLGYAEGPEEYRLHDTLAGKSIAGAEALEKDWKEADEKAGFSHYITDGRLTMLNDYTLIRGQEDDDLPPVWSSVCNCSDKWPPHEPEPRVGIREALPIKGGAKVLWDVALDRSGVTYVLSVQDRPFDFDRDPELEDADRLILTPSVSPEYENGMDDALPYFCEVTGLESRKEYFLNIRATDNSKRHNTEKNTVWLTVTPL